MLLLAKRPQVGAALGQSRKHPTVTRGTDLRDTNTLYGGYLLYSGDHKM